MKSKTFTLRRAITLVMPSVLLAAIAINAQMDRQLARAQQDNALALKQYEWKTRTEIRKDGETKRVEVVLNSYDSNGQVQKTVISSTPEPSLPKFGLRRRIAKNKLEDFREKIASLAALAQTYAELPADKKQSFMANAAITSANNHVRVEGRDVLHPGDTMTLFLDAATRKQRRLEIQTSLNDKPVKIISEFQDLSANGPTFMARSQVNYDGDSIAIITENFEYVRRQARNQ